MQHSFTPSLFSKEMHILAISIFFLRQNLALVENTDIYSTHRSTKKSLNSMGSKSKHWKEKKIESIKSVTIPIGNCFDRIFISMYIGKNVVWNYE